MNRKLNASDLERSKQRIKNNEDIVIGGRLDELQETHEDFLSSGMSENEANFATANCLDYDHIY